MRFAIQPGSKNGKPDMTKNDIQGKKRSSVSERVKLMKALHVEHDDNANNDEEKDR